jgi:hypothetical protein
MDNINDNKRVQCIWCKCNKSIARAIALDVERSASEKAAITMEINQAKKFGIKTEVVTLIEYKKLPFMNCECLIT